MSVPMNPQCEFIQRGDFNDCLHSAGGRGQLFEDCCAPCREEVLKGIVTLGAALRAHDEWCGYNADAPGNGIVNRAAETSAWMNEWAKWHATLAADRRVQRG